MAGTLSRRVGARIRALRVARDQSLEQLCRDHGLSKSSLWETEAGRTSPTLDYLQRIADALGVAITDLFVDSESTAAPAAAQARAHKTRAKSPA